MNAQSDIKAGNLLDALATALPELEGAKKNAANPHLKSKYADLGSVIDAVRPIAAHGLWFIQETHESERGVMVETHYIGFGERISAGKLFVPANKQDAQGYGSALTYARRYSLQTAFGLSTEDDDGHAAARGQSKSEVSPAAAPKHDARKDPWGKFYSGRSALHKGLVTHEAELNRIGVEGTLDDLETYLTSPEYTEFVQIAGEHMPHYLEGGDPAPPEFRGIFAVEQKARDMIVIRGNVPAEQEN